MLLIQTVAKIEIASRKNIRIIRVSVY